MCSAAGQEDDLASAKPALYSSANAFVLCYSIISPSSYESVRSKVRAIALVRGERERESAHLPYDVAQWLSEIRHYNTHAPILLVGTKPDLRDNPHIVSRLQERDLQPLTYKQGHQLAKGLLRLRISSASANQRTHTRKHADTLAMYRVCACRNWCSALCRGHISGSDRWNDRRGAVCIVPSYHQGVSARRQEKDDECPMRTSLERRLVIVNVLVRTHSIVYLMLPF